MTKPSGKRLFRFRSLVEKLQWELFLPTRRGLLVVAAGSLLIPLGFWAGIGWYGFWVYNGIFVLVSVVDLVMLPHRSAVRATRIMPERVEQGRAFEVTLELTLPGSSPLTVSAADDLPLSCSFHGLLTGVQDKEKVGIQLAYTSVPAERGAFPLNYLYVRYSGGLGLWSKQTRVPAEGTLRVFPDLSGVRGIMASLQDTLVLEGKRLHRRTRSGMEFHYIRDYTPDDDPRSINWSASARAGRFMSNVRQPEKGRTVTLLIDSGRLMGMELDGRVKLDRSIEAALCLAAVALKQGDQVAALVFAGDIRVYTPPGRGMGHLQTILEALYAIQSEPVETNYSLALEYIMKFQRKRSFVVLFSDMENYLFEEELVPYLVKLRRTHPILLLSLEDPVIAEWARLKAEGLNAAYIKSTAQSFRLDRKRYTSRMAGYGIHVLDVRAGDLALAAVNHYLELKSKESI